MKTPRFFILLGALALVFGISLGAIGPTVDQAHAQTIPIVRADPRAGDPDEPGFAKAIPFDDDAQYLQRTLPYETTVARPATELKPPVTFGWRQIFRVGILPLLLFGRR